MKLDNEWHEYELSGVGDGFTLTSFMRLATPKGTYITVGYVCFRLAVQGKPLLELSCFRINQKVINGSVVYMLNEPRMPPNYRMKPVWFLDAELYRAIKPAIISEFVSFYKLEGECVDVDEIDRQINQSKG